MLALLLALLPHLVDFNLPPITPIQHIVIIVQENRTVDNLFQGFPNANTQSYGYEGQTQITLQSQDLVTSWDINHAHVSWLAACDEQNGACAMDGWNNQGCSGGTCPTNAAFSYVPQSQVQPYWTMAGTYTLADNSFQTNQGPSFPAHQLLLSATSAIDGCNMPTCNWLRIAENVGSAGCDASLETRVQLIDANGSEAHYAFPCRTSNSLIQELESAGLSWHYYQSGDGTGLWHGPDALKYLCPNRPCSSNADFANNVITTPAQVITDVGNGYLANVTWVTPTSAASDHAGATDGSGPAWVASVVNAVGESPFWDSTAIFVTWDDWGGWYDHVGPTIKDSYAYGFRVPVIIISPYANLAYVDHTQRDVYGSLARYAEETFSLPSLGAYDADADDFSADFNYAQNPTPFVPIAGSKPSAYWKKQKPGMVDY